MISPDAFIQQRQIRVFVSSTFKDMQAERELLVKQVFPELRQMCAERFVTFTEVDLRWGITEEQAAEGSVLPICLEEIYRCRPYFIAFLGERYGWIPDTVASELLSREPWLREHVTERTSVTELEILHGVLNNPAMADHAFFYFRDPGYISSVPEQRRTDFLPENPKSRARLINLKDRIRHSGFPVVENYAHPAALAAAVRERFIILIDRLYPREEVPDKLDQEAHRQATYARSKMLACVERPFYTQLLDNFAASESQGRGLVLTGESGAGKTALLAAWVQHWQIEHPDDFVFQHYFGATPESAAVPAFMQRLLGELKRRFDIAEEIPGELDQLAKILPLWLARSIGKGRVVMVIDALNQIDGPEPDRRLTFMPHYFPSHVRVIASALPGPALETLEQRDWERYTLVRTDPTERTGMIEAFFEHYHKTLNSDLKAHIAAAAGSANPLYLRTLLEELRQFGSFEQLPARVAHYLAAETPRELFRLVLNRWREDFDGGQHLVRRSLGLLWAARQGLAETEWLTLLRSDNVSFHRQDWIPLFLAMEPHLVQRAGLYAFGHDFLRQAVQEAFLPTGTDQGKVHNELADYFERQEAMTSRKASEWPWQLQSAEDWGRLETALIDRELFAALYNDRTKWELSGYWHPLREKGAVLAEKYRLAFDQWLQADKTQGGNHYLSYQLGSFLMDNGAYSEAVPFLLRALKGYEQAFGIDSPDYLRIVNSLVLALERMGEYAGAVPLCRWAMARIEKALGKEHPDTLTVSDNLAFLLVHKGDYTEAGKLHRRVLEARERVLGKDHPDTLKSVNNLAALVQLQGDYAGAESLHRRALEGFERVLGKEHPDTLGSLNNLAVLHQLKGDYSGAEPLHRRVLDVRERVLGKDHNDTLLSANNLAMVLHLKGDYAHAEPLYKRTLRGYEQTLGNDHPDTITIVNNLAGLFKSKGDFEAAEPMFRRALEGYARALGKDHQNSFRCLNNLAGVLKNMGNIDEAEALYRQALKGSERVLGKDHPDSLAFKKNLDKLLEDRLWSGFVSKSLDKEQG